MCHLAWEMSDIYRSVGHLLCLNSFSFRCHLTNKTMPAVVKYYRNSSYKVLATNYFGREERRGEERSGVERRGEERRGEERRGEERRGEEREREREREEEQATRKH